MEETKLLKLLVSREEAEEKIQARIDEGQKLRDRSIDSDQELDIVGKEAINWSRYNYDLLITLFANFSSTNEYDSFYYPRMTDEDRWEHADGLGQYHILKLDCKVNEYKDDMEDSIKSLEGIRARLELFEEPDPPERIFGDKIFIVHGHDEAAKHKIARFITDLDLSETILDEQPGKGQTMIDKFEEHADEAGFAIVLLTADDIGAPKDQKDNLQPRARQNVILELGYFIALLGRERVCVLYEKDVELPSDIHGLSYLSYMPMGNDEGWKLKLAREIKNIGLPINLENLL